MTAFRSLLALAALALAVVVSGASAQTRDVFFQNVGPPGAKGAFVLGTDDAESVVVFLHGWRNVETGPYYPWLEYLALSGSTVIFPRYQSAAGGSPAATLAALRSGVAAGLATVPRKGLPVIVVGHDFGARLAYYYAADAERWDLPVPAAIDSIFPSAAPKGMPALPAIPGATRVLLQVGANDTVAGRPAAADLWNDLRGHARKQYRVVKSTAGFKAEHRAPAKDASGERAAFWPSLNALIEQSLSTG